MPQMFAQPLKIELRPRNYNLDENLIKLLDNKKAKIKGCKPAFNF